MNRADGPVKEILNEKFKMFTLRRIDIHSCLLARFRAGAIY
jgi:hypothetical protein